MLKPYDTDPAPFQPNDPSGSYLLMLIAAFGGLPIDYRTDPPTINFTDAATVDAIRQVLDLAKDGYIAYTTGNSVKSQSMLRMSQRSPQTRLICSGALALLALKAQRRTRLLLPYIHRAASTE